MQKCGEGMAARWEVAMSRKGVQFGRPWVIEYHADTVSKLPQASGMRIKSKMDKTASLHNSLTKGDSRTHAVSVLHPVTLHF